jgi:hypothetical protein
MEPQPSTPKLRIVGPCARLIAILALCLGSSALHARDWFKDGRVGAGVDVIHQAGMPVVSVALYPASILVWEDNGGVALTYPIGPRVGWSGAVGAMVVAETDDDLGTHLNLLLRLSYCGQKLCLSFAHISHGGAIGIETDKANSGLNFLYLEYRYR